MRAKHHRGSPLLFPLILLAFFGLGWQISEIDPKRLVTDFPQAMLPLCRVIWPWEAAITREPVIEKAGASIRVPTAPGGGPPPTPFVRANPACWPNRARASSRGWTTTTPSSPARRSPSRARASARRRRGDLVARSPAQRLPAAQGRELPQRHARRQRPFTTRCHALLHGPRRPRAGTTRTGSRHVRRWPGQRPGRASRFALSLRGWSRPS